MLVELAIGDAYGAGFEYVRDRRFLTRNNKLHAYVQHPRHRRKPGVYTDDTQMSIAIAELIVDGSPWTEERLAGKFVEVFHRDPREGYAGGFYAFLKKTRTGEAFLANIRPDSDKSGAAMRASPIGVYPSIDAVIERSSLQAALTHNTPDGINAAVAASLMTHYFLYGLGAKKDLPDFLVEHVPGNWHEPWMGEVGSRGWMSVRAAIASVVRHESLAAVLKSAVAWGGDTDTVAAIALATGSCCQELVPDLPDRLFHDLEKGQYGLPFLRELDKALLNQVNSKRTRTWKPMTPGHN